MFRLVRPLIAALLLAPIVVVSACGGTSQPPAEKTAPPDPPKPAVDVAKHMHEHLARVTDIQEAVVRGDMEAAVEPARWIADHQETEGLPAGTASFVADMKKSAAVVAEAKDFRNAATATAMVVSYCGACHEAAKAKISLADLPKPTARPGLAAHMLDHQWAVDLMYQGLIVPSDDQWKQGIAALKAAPLAAADLPKDTKLTGEIRASEKKLHDLADKAVVATDVGSKVAVYAEVLDECATCHGLHGKVWGPGLPKTK
jgi:cytochrome c553